MAHSRLRGRQTYQYSFRSKTWSLFQVSWCFNCFLNILFPLGNIGNCQCQLIFLLLWTIRADSLHFNGGTITWAPLDPNTNSSSVVITITQTYSWRMPNIRCDTDVPISTPGWGSQNDILRCIVDCSTDGGYSANPINILTDCISSSESLGMMTSRKSKNVTLAAGAYFSLAYQNGDWRPLGSPARSGLDWSIVSSIDLRRRPDGLINTPPVVTIASPQYVLPNETVQIKIPVSDMNQNDDIRCRWSAVQPGQRRRRENSENKVLEKDDESLDFGQENFVLDFILHRRQKRQVRSCDDSDCRTRCRRRCRCNCTGCISTNCGNPDGICQRDGGCRPVTTTDSTTSETPGTRRSTSSFARRQAVDECAGICYPNSLPSGVQLSNCTLSFTGWVPNTWYAVALQVWFCFYSFHATARLPF